MAMLSYLMAEVRRIAQLGVHVVGIGVGPDFVHQIYPESLVATDFSEMVEDLFAILVRQVRRRENGNRVIQAEGVRAA